MHKHPKQIKGVNMEKLVPLLREMTREQRIKALLLIALGIKKKRCGLPR